MTPAGRVVVAQTRPQAHKRRTERSRHPLTCQYRPLACGGASAIEWLLGRLLALLVLHDGQDHVLHSHAELYECGFDLTWIQAALPAMLVQTRFAQRLARGELRVVPTTAARTSLRDVHLLAPVFALAWGQRCRKHLGRQRFHLGQYVARRPLTMFFLRPLCSARVRHSSA
jgi:hypothetical protein